MDDDPHLISDLVIPPSTTTSGETSEHVTPEAEPQVEFFSEVITATSNDMVSMHSHVHKNIQ